MWPKQAKARRKKKFVIELENITKTDISSLRLGQDRTGFFCMQTSPHSYTEIQGITMGPNDRQIIVIQYSHRVGWLDASIAFHFLDNGTAYNQCHFYVLIQIFNLYRRWNMVDIDEAF